MTKIMKYKIKKDTSCILYKLQYAKLNVIDPYCINLYENAYSIEDVVWDEWFDCCFFYYEEHPYSVMLTPTQLERLRYIHKRGYVVIHRNFQKSIGANYFLCIPSDEIFYLKGRKEYQNAEE